MLSLENCIVATPVGSEAVTRLAVLRNGSPRTIQVTLSKYAVRGKKVVTAPDPTWRGLRIDYPTAVVDGEGHFSGGMSFVDDAVIVVEVAEGSPAWEAGLRRGTLVTHVDGAAVRTPKDFATAVARNRGLVQLRVAGDEKNPVRTVRPEL
jgi:serine protease Do